jgi:hypothetical protein
LPLMSFILVIATGCKPSATATGSSTDPADTSKVRKLNVTAPKDVSIKQNGADEFTISITRENFKGPVEIEFKNLPSGVSVTTQDLTIPAGKDSIKVALNAKPDATVADNNKVKIAAKAKEEKGMDEAAGEMVVHVKSKE